MSKWVIDAILGLGFLPILLVSCMRWGSNLSEPLDTDPKLESGRPIVLGDISDDPSEVIEGTQPLANYLASE